MNKKSTQKELGGGKLLFSCLIASALAMQPITSYTLTSAALVNATDNGDRPITRGNENSDYWNFDDSNGYCYNYVDKDVKTVEVFSNWNYPGDTDYILDFDIPKTVSYQDEIYTVVRIADNAFAAAECYDLYEGQDGPVFISTLESVTIPTTVTHIGSRAFWQCSILEKVTFTEGSQLKPIGNEAFEKNYKLQEVVIPESVTSIGDKAFE